jgi:acetoin utilization deacetylase AcuC-like enzyme
MKGNLDGGMMASKVQGRRQFLQTAASGVAGAVLANPLMRISHAAEAAPLSTGYLNEQDFVDHVLSEDHVESPARLEAIARRMKETGLAERVKLLDLAADSAEAEGAILRIHTRQHLDAIDSCGTTGIVARRAVAGVLAAVKAVDEGTVDNAFCPVRPPGHHAHGLGSCQGEGFCFYNNVAIAARYAQRELGYAKILIIDWDYHHGNGTQDAFYSDPSALFFSTHSYPAYPGTGDPAMIGSGSGEGYNINVHLDCECTDGDMIAAWDEKLMPKARAFEPDFVLISAGFDSRKDDPLGCFHITDAGFVALTKKAMQIAGDWCEGRLVSVLEGGYNVDGLASAVAAHVATLMGEEAPAPDASRCRARRAPQTVPVVRRGILHLPSQYRTARAVSVFDARGRCRARLLFERSQQTTVDLGQLGLSSGRYVLAFEGLGDGALRVPFELLR